MSLPSRERELKPAGTKLLDEDEVKSLPSRERELKLRLDHLAEGIVDVAPFTGA